MTKPKKMKKTRMMRLRKRLRQTTMVKKQDWRKEMTKRLGSAKEKSSRGEGRETEKRKWKRKTRKMRQMKSMLKQNEIIIR